MLLNAIADPLRNACLCSYIQRLVDDLSHKLAVTAKSKRKVQELQQQRAEASQLVADSQPQLKALATRVLALKANVRTE